MNDNVKNATKDAIKILKTRLVLIAERPARISVALHVLRPLHFFGGEQGLSDGGAAVQLHNSQVLPRTDRPLPEVAIAENGGE